MNTVAMGLTLKERRIQAGMTQQQLAERMGVNQSSVARMEAGWVEVSLSTLARVAEAFGMEPSHLLQLAETRELTKEELALSKQVGEEREAKNEARRVR